MKHINEWHEKLIKVYKAISYKISGKGIKKYKMCYMNFIWPMIHLLLTNTSCKVYCNGLSHTIRIKHCITKCFSVQVLCICSCFHAYTESIQTLTMQIWYFSLIVNKEQFIILWFFMLSDIAFIHFNTYVQIKIKMYKIKICCLLQQIYCQYHFYFIFTSITFNYGQVLLKWVQ